MSSDFRFQDSFSHKLDSGLDPQTGLPSGGLDSCDLGMDSSDSEQQKSLKEFRQLLGPLVPALLRDEQGALDLSKIKAKSFEEFKKFLAAQAAVDDHITLHFSRLSLDPYEALLEDPKYEALLRRLYKQLDSQQHVLLSASETRVLVKDFQAELIEIDADAFAGHYATSKAGRQRLNRLLSPESKLSKDGRCDLVKALYRIGEAQGVLSNVDLFRIRDNLSTWNYFNLSVSDRELEIASYGALSVLRSGEFVSSRAETQRKDFSQNLKSHAWLSDGGTIRRIDPKKIKKFIRLSEQDPSQGGAIHQVQGQVAKLWLMAADQRNWRDYASEDEGKLRAYLLKKCEALLEETQGIASPQGLAEFQERLQNFLHDPVYLNQSKTLTWVKHQAMGEGLHDHFAELPSAYRAPLEELTQLSDTWKYSMKMGGRIRLQAPEIKLQDEKRRAQVQAMIQGLERTKHGLWYGYKQHKAISRTISQAARLVGAGDVTDIQKAQVALEGFIVQLSEANSEQDLDNIREAIFKSLKEDGVLYQALEAAQMDGTEQFLGLIQTMAVMTALAGAPRVLSTLTKGGGALGRFLGTAQGLQNANVVDRMARGTSLGVQITTAENVIAVASGEVRNGPETVGKWFKDAVATGFSMGLTGLLPMSHGAAQGFIKNLMARYTVGGYRGIRFFLMDTGMEAFEESVDAYFRQALDGKAEALTVAQLREIGSLCLSGGGLKVGGIAEYIKGAQQASTVKNPDGPPDLSSPENVRNVFKPERNDTIPAAAANQGSSGPSLGAILTTLGAGLTTFLTPEIADAFTLNQIVQGTADVGSAVATQGFWPGVLTTLGVGALGILGMAVNKGGKKEQDPPLNAAEKKKLEGIYQSYPDLKTALSKTNWTPRQKYQFLNLLAEKAGRGVAWAYKTLPATLTALEATDWTTEQKHQFLLLLAEKAKWQVGSAYANLPTALKVLKATGWSYEQQTQFLLLDSVYWAYNYLPAALKALEGTGWNSEQKYQFLSSVAVKSSKETYLAYELLPSLKKYSPGQYEKTLKDFSRLLDSLSDYNRVRVLKCLRDNKYLFSKLGSENFSQHFSLYVTLFERWPRLGFNLLEGVVEATKKGILPKEISDHRHKILAFIKKTNGFIPVIYEAFLKEGDALFPRLKVYTNDILKDEFSLADAQKVIQEEGEEFLLALIQITSPTSGASFVKKAEQLGLLRKMLKAGDHRGHIPLAWRGLVKGFELDQGAWLLKEGQEADPEGKIRTLLGQFRVSENAPAVEEKELVKALTQYLSSGKNQETRERLKQLLYQFAGQNDALKEKIDRIQDLDYTTLILLEQLFGDKDNLQKILGEALDKVPAELLVGQGKKQGIKGDGKRLIRSLKKVWGKKLGGKTLSQEKRIEILASILKAFEAKDIKEKLLSRKDLDPTLKAAIEQVMHHAPDISKGQIISEILGEATGLIQTEKNKYAYQNAGKIQVGLRAVKGPTFGLHGLSSGVCTAMDLELWNNPNFKLLAITDENSAQVVGHVQVFETEIKGKKYLTLPGINPSAEFLGTVDAKQLYEGMMTQIQAFAEAGDYHGIYIPTAANIHSNRSDIQKAIQKAPYPIKNIPEVQWNTLPSPYPFTEVYVVWERSAKTVQETSLSTLNDKLHAFAAPALVGMEFLLNGEITGFGIAAGLATLVLGMALSKGDKKSNHRPMTSVDWKKLEEIFSQHTHLEGAFDKNGFGPEASRDLLETIAEKAGKNVDWAYKTLPATLTALEATGWSSEQKFQFLTLLAEKAGSFFDLAYVNLPTALTALEGTDWSSEQKFQFLSLLAEKAGDSVYGAYANLPVALKALKGTGWSYERKRQFLSSVAEKSSRETGWAYELLPSLKKYSPEHFQKHLKDFSRLLDSLSDYNRGRVLRLLYNNQDLFSNLGSENFSQHFSLYVTLFERWPRLGFNLLEGVVEATKKGIIPKEISDHREKILTFIEKTNGFIPALYEAYLKEGDALLPRLKAYTDAILKDELSLTDAQKVIQEEGEEFLLALIQMTSPTSGASFVKKEEQLGLLRKMLKAGDRREDIPPNWKDRLKTFTMDQGGYRLKDGEKADPEGRVKTLLHQLKPSREDQGLSEEDLVAALEAYLRSDRKVDAQRRVRKIFYSLAGQNELLRQKIDEIKDLDYEGLNSLLELFNDRDAFTKLLADTLKKVPTGVLEGKGEKKPFKSDGVGYVKTLKNNWVNSAGKERQERIQLLSKMISHYKSEDIRAKVLSSPQLDKELKNAIEEALNLAPDLKALEVIDEILQGPRGEIEREEAKYEFGLIGSRAVGLRAVKGVTYGMWGLTAGVCTAGDIKLWKNPKFKPFAMLVSDLMEAGIKIPEDVEMKEVVGYTQAFEITLEGKKYLTLPGINPSSEFISTVETEAFFKAHMEKIIAFAKDEGYHGVYIPTDPNIHSNRMGIKKAIQKAPYPIKNIPEVQWNTLPNPYPFTEVYVAWERSIKNDSGFSAGSLLATLGAGLATLLSPDIANATALNHAVQGAADVGSAIATQGFWPGLLTALGVGSLGAWAMAVSRKGGKKSGPKVRRTPEQIEALEKVQGYIVNLKDFDENGYITRAIETLANLFPSLHPEDRLSGTLRIAEFLTHYDYNVRTLAGHSLGSVGLHLDPKACLTLALWIVNRFKGRGLPQPAVIALEKIIPHLEPKDRLSVALKIEEQLDKDDYALCKTGAERVTNRFVLSALPKIIPSLEPNDRLVLALKIEERLGGYDSFWTYQSLIILGKIVPFLDPKDKIGRALKIASWLEYPHWHAIPREASYALEGIFPLLNPTERSVLLAEIITQQEGEGEYVPALVANILQKLQPQMLLRFAKRHGEKKLILLASYHEAHLPFDPYFWEACLQAKDPIRWIEETAREVEPYRRGKALSSLNEDELHLAYAGLDSPEGLTYEAFKRKIKDYKLSPFLKRPFKALVHEVRSFHGLIDKGKIRKALDPIESVKDAEAARNHLNDLIENEKGALKRIKTDLEAAFPRRLEGLTLEELLGGARSLLSRIDTKRPSPPVQRLIIHLGLLLAWHREGIEPLKSKMEAVRQIKVPSETLWEGLKATEEFYRDTLNDAFNGLGIDGDQIPFLKKQRRLLVAERERTKKERGESVEVEFLPSRGQADQFFGWVGEDCTKEWGESLYRERFQVYRMISGGRLTGMLYLQDAVLDGKKVLVMAIQPRTFWEIDQQELLRVIEGNFSRIAKEEGYDAVLLMDGRGQQSNRQDMLQAIDERPYPSINFNNGLSGAVFRGKQFLVMWEKGMPVPSLKSFDPDPSFPPVASVQVQMTPRPADLAPFQALSAQIFQNLPVDVRQRMARLNPEFLEEMRQAYEQAGLTFDPRMGPMGPVREGGEEITQALTQRGALVSAAPSNEMIPPGTLILERRALEAILTNPSVTRTDQGWFEPTLRGKRRVVISREVVGEGRNTNVPARGDEATPQDLFDFYNAVYYQCLHFRGYLHLLQNRGADIQRLAPWVHELGQKLEEGLEHLLARRFEESLRSFQEAGATVTRFQEELRDVSHTVGLEVDAVTGMISPAEDPLNPD